MDQGSFSPNESRMSAIQALRQSQMLRAQRNRQQIENETTDQQALASVSE
jgi:hypothetical protein